MPKKRSKAEPQQVQRGDVKNFETLVRAAKDGALGLMRCTRKSDGAFVTLLVARNPPDADGLIALTPLAQLFEGDPYAEFEPPG